MKLFIATLSLAVLCMAGDLSAGRRSPTFNEQQNFSPILKMWMAKNWQNKMKYNGGYVSQRIVKIDLCCIDAFDERELYIVDIAFHAKWLEGGRVIDEADMVQRLLFRIVNGKIKDWDPMPAYQADADIKEVS